MTLDALLVCSQSVLVVVSMAAAERSWVQLVSSVLQFDSLDATIFRESSHLIRGQPGRSRSTY